ncbi:galactosylgalactosylxylosylprotein 3-beta-glucuronosyltransferase 1-like isoform X2 [Dunckerocampus dactyliophorus]|uniref:galactosylgalactosylxylosylprotein 3-beta-glucuronosyltransferase 1-like isoform X2 n=1 Tax=Dunckerocampus dactyliophorus TaxID=161453 RepID=UPI002404FC47|nr:galactosylgalactosylxylosylprotein 3-beta-glucuronosyltransferase 1-like isoform X2 [Dunckerocampus dactyliophorus]
MAQENSGHRGDGDSASLPPIYVITPTYHRPMQKAELTRLTNTFLNVANLHWIVVEDSQTRTPLVSHLLRESGLKYTHLNVISPQDSNRQSIRGISQRNLGLQWLRSTFNVSNPNPGVVYFGDDDNTYSLKLFDEMRWTKKVSVWPVAFAGGLRYESIKVNTKGKVYGWEVAFAPQRPFAIDMAGFAVNLQLILSKPEAYFKPYTGRQEGSLLMDLATLDDLEPKADNCTKVLVWHTRSQAPNLSRENGFKHSANVET